QIILSSDGPGLVRPLTGLPSRAMKSIPSVTRVYFQKTDRSPFMGRRTFAVSESASASAADISESPGAPRFEKECSRTKAQHFRPDYSYVEKAGRVRIGNK
ncbi:MAG: hypothetical protein WC247_15605, partial [Porticoccaceae bacterium]